MGKITKIIFASAIVMLLLIYLGVGIYLNNTITEKINSLETQAIINNKKKEYFVEQSISFASIKNNLETELALEKEKEKQRELQATLDNLNEEARLKYLEQQQAALAEQQRFAALQRQQTITTSSTTTSSPTSSPVTVTKSPTRAS